MKLTGNLHYGSTKVIGVSSKFSNFMSDSLISSLRKNEFLLKLSLFQSELFAWLHICMINIINTNNYFFLFSLYLYSLVLDLILEDAKDAFNVISESSQLIWTWLKQQHAFQGCKYQFCKRYRLRVDTSKSDNRRSPASPWRLRADQIRVKKFRSIHFALKIDTTPEI